MRDPSPRSLSSQATRLVSVRSSNATRERPLQQHDSRASAPATPPQLRRSRKPKRLKTSQPFARLMSAFAGSHNNNLEELASRARVHSRIDLHKQDGSRIITKDASIYKDYSRVVKVKPTVAMRKETQARPWREESIVTMAGLVILSVSTN